MLLKLPHDNTIFMAPVKQKAYFQKVFCNTYSLPVASSTSSLQTNWTYCTQQRVEEFSLTANKFQFIFNMPDYTFDVHMSVHRKYISKVQPTRCVFSIYLFL